MRGTIAAVEAGFVSNASVFSGGLPLSAEPLFSSIDIARFMT